MTNAVLANGTQLQKQDPNTLAWAMISEVRSIQGLDMAQDEKDVTNHSSPNHARERVGTLVDPGQLAFEINYIPSDPTQNEVTGVLGDLVNRNRPQFRLILPNTGQKMFTFPGFVKEFKMKEPVDDVITASLTIRVISFPTITGS